MTFSTSDFYYPLVDCKLSRNFLVDPSRRQVGHPWCSAKISNKTSSYRITRFSVSLIVKCHYSLLDSVQLYLKIQSYLQTYLLEFISNVSILEQLLKWLVHSQKCFVSLYWLHCYPYR